MSDIIRDISDKKFNAMQKMMIVPWDPISVALKSSIKFSEEGKSFKGYFLYITGTIYLFKKKAFGRFDLFRKRSLLDCQKMFVPSEVEIEFTFDDEKYYIGMGDTSKVARIIYKEMLELFFDNASFEMFSIAPEDVFKGIIVKKHPDNALKRRCIAMAHFYNYAQEDDSPFDYFNKYEEQQGEYIQLGVSYNPGAYTVPFAHAIAWEPRLSAITFAANTKPCVLKTISVIIQNTIKIDKINFAGYKKPIKEFKLKTEGYELIKKWWFADCKPEFTLQFLNETKGLFSEPFDEFNISHIRYEEDQFDDIIAAFSANKSARRAKCLRLSDINIDSAKITRFLKNTDRLTTLAFAGISLSPTEIFKAIVKSGSRVKNIQFEKYKFTGDIMLTELPPSLVCLGASKCTFSVTALKSLFEYICATPIKIPIAVQLQSISTEEGAFESLNNLDFGALSPNISELDLSLNLIPKNCYPGLFSLLKTQTRLRMLVLLDIQLKNTELFWKGLLDVIYTIKLPGLDVTGKFPSSFFIDFIKSMKSYTFMRRLQISCRACHDDGMEALAETIESMPQLSEVIADGFKPETASAFEKLWVTIGRLPELTACDFPDFDMRSLGLTFSNIEGELLTALERIKSLPKPSMLRTRVDSLIDRLEQRESFDD